MLNIIVAVSKQSNGRLGIGLGNKMAWRCKQELNLFKEKTFNNVLIMGRNTVESIPLLRNREIYCLSTQSNIVNNEIKTFGKNEARTFRDMHNAISHARERYPTKKIFIAGGSCIYDYIMNNYPSDNKQLHISYMNDEYTCDKFFPNLNNNVICLERIVHDTFTHYVLDINSKSQESDYLDLLNDTLNNGVYKKCRNGGTFSLFSKHLKFDLTKGFPLLTTKKMFFRGVVEEFLFFLRGQTDTKILENKGINIWKGNTSREFLDSIGMNDRREGVMGPMYGYMWRHYGAKYDHQHCKPLDNTGIDQLKNVIDLIKSEPNSRRIIITDYNPLQVDEGVLYPCHSIIIQFYVSDGYLDMLAMSRSCDTFLGAPFNIASYALLLCIVSKLTHLIPRYLNICLGDTHVYEEHIDAVKTQINRFPYRFPQLIIKDINTLCDAEQLSYDDFNLVNYSHYPSIKAKMLA